MLANMMVPIILLTTFHERQVTCPRIFALLKLVEVSIFPLLALQVFTFRGLAGKILLALSFEHFDSCAYYFAISHERVT